MRVALKHRTVHERAGVALVGITYDILLRSLVGRAERPLASGREASAPASAETGFRNGCDDLVGSHFGKTFCKRLITVACYVFVYILGVDDAAVAERDPYLLTVEVGLVERLDNAVVSDSLLVKKTGDNVSVDKVLLHDLGNVIDIDHRIEASLGINYHDRSESAETETSGGDDLYVVFDPVCPDLAVKSLNDLLAVGRCTSGTAADENVLLIIRLDRRKLFVSAAERDGSKSFVADGVKFCYCFHQCFFLLFSGISRFQSQRKAG